MRYRSRSIAGLARQVERNASRRNRKGVRSCIADARRGRSALKWRRGVPEFERDLGEIDAAGMETTGATWPTAPRRPRHLPHREGYR